MMQAFALRWDGSEGAMTQAFYDVAGSRWRSAFSDSARWHQKICATSVVCACAWVCALCWQFSGRSADGVRQPDIAFDVNLRADRDGDEALVR